MSLIIVKDWTAEKAEYQMQATKFKHGQENALGSQAREGVHPMELTKLMVRRKVRAGCVVKVMPPGIAMFLRKSVQEKWGTANKLGLFQMFGR